jgi:murein DD-endopeptidase MepM/ murein hydrolase activator NlpD
VTNKFFIIIPPNNKRIRYIRIRLSIIILIILFFLGGVAGFLIPFNSLTLDEVEINQKKHLTVQNKKLQKKITSMRKTLLVIKKKMDTLSETKKNISSYIPIQIINKKRPSNQDVLEKMSLDEIEKHVMAIQKFYNKYAELIKETPDYVEYVPCIKPVSEPHIITLRFGKKRDPFTGKQKYHEGIDFTAERETPVFATASGTVISVIKKHNHWGRQIKIKHKYGFSTYYAHLGTVVVRNGKKVKKGEKIATIGLSGLTTGPHLHYEIHRHGTPVDPEKYFFPEYIQKNVASSDTVKSEYIDN